MDCWGVLVWGRGVEVEGDKGNGKGIRGMGRRTNGALEVRLGLRRRGGRWGLAMRGRGGRPRLTWLGRMLGKAVGVSSVCCCMKW